MRVLDLNQGWQRLMRPRWWPDPTRIDVIVETTVACLRSIQAIPAEINADILLSQISLSIKSSRTW